jgi:hypothetical protein
MIPSELFELINAALSSLAIGVLVIFLRTMLLEYIYHGLHRVRLQGLISVSIVIVGEVITRGWMWLVGYLSNTDADAGWLLKLPWGLVPIIGASIEAIGLLCIIRVFSPNEWGNRGWLICAGMAAAMVISSMAIRDINRFEELMVGLLLAAVAVRTIWFALELRRKK